MNGKTASTAESGQDFRKEFYDRYAWIVSPGKQDDASEMAAWRAWAERKYLPLLNGLPSDAPILEVGCGRGWMLHFLRIHGFTNAHGIDISPEQVAIADARGVRVELADAVEYLASRSSCFDAVLALDFIEHFQKPELLSLLGLVNRALKVGGTFIVQTPNAAGLFPGQVMRGDPTHCTFFSPESLDRMLRITGFTDVSFYETGPVAKNVVGAIRLVLWNCIKLAANAVRIIETGKTQKIWTENFICRARKSLT